MKDEIYLKKLGEKIFNLRHAQNISQEKLAEQVGTSRNQLSRVEMGKVNSSINMLRKIAKELGMPISVLVDVSGK